MVGRMKLAAPAKVNLHLRILGRRPDGFHDIETLMAPLELADEVEVELADGIHVTCDDPSLPSGGDNLAGRAAMAFFAATGGGGARIHIRKRIPSGAGLGGGSSDAVAVLLALAQLTGAGLGESKLLELASSLGSDCPWFVIGKPAICSGRGELVGPEVKIPEIPILLLKPPFGIPTPWAYSRWSEFSTTGLRADPEVQDLGWIKIFNSFEGPVFEKFVLLPVMKAWLRERPGVLAAGMSGSGSTIFAVLEDSARAPEISAEARRMFGNTLWTCATFVS